MMDFSMESSVNKLHIAKKKLWDVVLEPFLNGIGLQDYIPNVSHISQWLLATLLVKNIYREQKCNCFLNLIIKYCAVQLKSRCSVIENSVPYRIMKKLVLAQKSQNITNAIQKAAIETQKSQREIEKERRKELMSNLLGE